MKIILSALRRDLHKEFFDDPNWPTETVMQIRDFLIRLREKRIKVLIYCLGRTLREQARLYRQSRTTAEINLKIADLISKGCPASANALLDVGPQRGVLGRHVTHAVPGKSWHNWPGCAFDGVPIAKGNKLAWDTVTYEKEWKRYGVAAREAGLYWAGDWSEEKREFPHVQTESGKVPLIDLQRAV